MSTSYDIVQIAPFSTYIAFPYTYNAEALLSEIRNNDMAVIVCMVCLWILIRIAVNALEYQEEVLEPTPKADVPNAPATAPAVVPQQNDLLSSVAKLLHKKNGQTASAILKSLGSSELTKSDINKCLYKLKACTKASVSTPLKGSPIWTAV
jgi:hypothetical protein